MAGLRLTPIIPKSLAARHSPVPSRRVKPVACDISQPRHDRNLSSWMPDSSLKGRPATKSGKGMIHAHMVIQEECLSIAQIGKTDKIVDRHGRALDASHITNKGRLACIGLLNPMNSLAKMILSPLHLCSALICNHLPYMGSGNLFPRSRRYRAQYNHTKPSSWDHGQRL
jgi:hypothetical protein